VTQEEEKAQKAATKVAKQREKEANKQQQQSKQPKGDKRRTESTLTSRIKPKKVPMMKLTVTDAALELGNIPV